jgi:hypothetical protein
MPELDAQDDGGEGDASDPPTGGFADSFDGVEEEDAEREKTGKVGTADLGVGDDNGIVAGFDGVEDEKGEEEQEESGSSSGSSGDPSIESAIENGLAEVAAVGLEGDERDRVYTEMNAIAGKFKIGYFGNRCVQKYLKRDIDDIPPEYGLAAALIAFGAIAVYKRPDGEEQIQHAVSIVKEKMSGGGDETPQQPPRQQPPQQADPRPSQQPRQQQRPAAPREEERGEEVAEVDAEPSAEVAEVDGRAAEAEVQNE